jgi:hypothetical protein
MSADRLGKGAALNLDAHTCLGNRKVGQKCVKWVVVTELGSFLELEFLVDEAVLKLIKRLRARLFEYPAAHRRLLHRHEAQQGYSKFDY